MIQDLLELRQQHRQAKLSRGQLEGLQQRKLKALLSHADANVPFYRDRFRAAGVKGHEFRALEDLPEFPVTKRDDLIQATPRHRIAAGLEQQQLLRSRTSGTIGQFLEVFHSKAERRQRRMSFLRALLAVGFSSQDRMAVLGAGSSKRRGLHEQLGFFRTQYISQRLAVKKQFDHLCKFAPTLVWFYPTALQSLCDYSARPMGEWLKARKMVSAAELLPGALRRRIERELGAEIFNFYGAIEFGRIAWECPAHEGMHVNADQLFVECLKDGCPAPPGESGKAVITALNGFASPMIRYELGDIIRFTGKPCSCGSAFPLISAPEGRSEQMLVLPSGRTRSAMVMELWIDASISPARYRIIQHRPDFIEILVSEPSVPGHEIESRLRATQVAYLEEELPFAARQVQDMAPDGRKFRRFESRLDTACS